MAIKPTDYKVAVICGGTSAERDVSLKSGEGASEALKEAGFDVTVLDPAHKEDLMRLLNEQFDVAFLCLHGRGGEDGAMQGFLQIVGLPYTGSGIQASALAIDKSAAKRIYREADIPTPIALCLKRGMPYDIETIIAQVGEHCVVKPATEGSSIGVSIVSQADELQTALDQAFIHDASVVVESFVEGVEVTVSVIGNETPEPFPVIQMIPRNDFYDFESKYAPGGSEHLCPAPLEEVITKRLQNLACEAHCALGCRGVSRTDFIIDPEGNPWCLETNTIPGMTATSLIPDAARAAGISFSEVCTRLVELALE